VSKSALVPSVVRSDNELVEANSKLSLISGVVGAIAIVPLTLLGKLSTTMPLVIGIGVFAAATLAARRLPRDVVAAKPAERDEKVELASRGIRAASHAMMFIRACIGFLTFHLLFWLRQDYGLAAFGLAAGASVLGSVLGNVVAPALRRRLKEQRMLIGALGVIAIAGLLAALTGGLGTAVVFAFVVNFSSSVGRMAFDSIVQRDAPDANQGRAFAQFETRFQLAWVLAGLPPVAFTLPGQIGFLVVGLMGLVALVLYLRGTNRRPTAPGGRSKGPAPRSRPGWAAPKPS
jgi:Na+/melibiose symporter-like transporter